jgi:hypothetical protein
MALYSFKFKNYFSCGVGLARLCSSAWLPLNTTLRICEGLEFEKRQPGGEAKYGNANMPV